MIGENAMKDSELIQKVHSGNKEAVGIIIERYYADIYRFYSIVMSHIRNIREKIEDNPSKPVYIQTVWGVGYRFNQTLQIREML